VEELIGARRGPGAAGTLLVLCATLTAGEPPPDAALPAVLPAYAHNDYENHPPLERALALGYQGVEADCFLVDGELRVAHNRYRVERGRTLESLYLEPLRERVEDPEHPLPGPGPFLLTIELKQADERAFSTLLRLLDRYAPMLTAWRDGEEDPGPILVVLVGWHPDVAGIETLSPRRFALQVRLRNLSAPAPVPEAPDLIRLVSVRYADLRRGAGDEPARMGDLLAGAAALRDRLPGSRLRVYDPTYDPAIYRMLLENGVDLIGIKDLAAGRKILLSLGADPVHPPP